MLRRHVALVAMMLSAGALGGCGSDQTVATDPGAPSIAEESSASVDEAGGSSTTSPDVTLGSSVTGSTVTEAQPEDSTTTSTQSRSDDGISDTSIPPSTLPPTIPLPAVEGVDRSQDGFAGERCEAVRDVIADYGELTGLERSELVTGDQLEAWQVGRFADSPFAGSPPRIPGDEGRAYAVCLYGGKFVTPAPPGVPEADRILVVVDDKGLVTLDAAGPHDSVGLVLPSDVLGSR